MIIIENTLVSEDLFEEHFVCDLSACKGVCCVEGDSGAPIGEDEIPILEQEWESAKPYMVPEGIAAIEREGLYQVDEDGDIVIGIMPNFSPFNHNRKHRFSTDYNSNTIKSGNLNEKIPNK